MYEWSSVLSRSVTATLGSREKWGMIRSSLHGGELNPASEPSSCPSRHVVCLIEHNRHAVQIQEPLSHVMSMQQFAQAFTEQSNPQGGPTRCGDHTVQASYGVCCKPRSREKLVPVYEMTNGLLAKYYLLVSTRSFLHLIVDPKLSSFLPRCRSLSLLPFWFLGLFLVQILVCLMILVDWLTSSPACPCQVPSNDKHTFPQLY